MLLELSLLTFVLAYLSWRFVETPFRQASMVKRSHLLAGSFLAAAFFIAFGLAGHFSGGFEFRIKNFEKIAGSFSVAGFNARCSSGDAVKGQTLDFCVLGNDASKRLPSAAVFGDSHAGALIPAFDHLRSRLGRDVVYSSLGGCPPLLGVEVLKGNFSEGVCSTLAERQYEYVKRSRVKKVFLVGRWSLYTDTEFYDAPKDGYYLARGDDNRLTVDSSRKVFRSALERTISEYAKLGVQVVVIFQVPQQTVRPLSMYTRLLMRDRIGTTDAAHSVANLSVAHSKHMALQSYSRSVIMEVAAKTGATYINPDPFLCNDAICPIGDASESFYSDANHLNKSGAVRVSDGLIDAFL